MFSSSLLLKDCSSGQLSLCLAAADGFFFMSLSYHLFLKPCKFVPSEGIMKGFLQGYQTVDAKTYSLLPSQLVGICRAMCVCVCVCLVFIGYVKLNWPGKGNWDFPFFHTNMPCAGQV